jgi:3-methyladenine DNA glycosylase AlkD
MAKNKHYRDILKAVETLVKEKKTKPTPAGYLGNRHFSYGLSNPQKRKIVREWKENHQDISPKEFIGLLDSLYHGRSYDEKTLAGILLENSRFKKEIPPRKLDEWLNFLEGWAEIDMTCQSSFGPDELLANWPAWEKVIKHFSGSSDISKRRASLVLLVKSVRNSSDKKLAGLALANIERLKGEKDVLITKAISWLLRSLIKHHRQNVENCLKRNHGSLPAIALRETSRKLKTGKK